MVLEWERFRFTRAIHLHVNLLHHRIQIAGNIRIPEADNPVSFLFKPSLPFAIALGDRIVVVMPAIELDNETLCRTEEIHNIGTDQRLTSEVRAFDRQFFQRAPNNSLMRCRMAA